MYVPVELVKNLNTQASQDVPIEQLIFPGQPLLVQGTLRHTISAQLPAGKVEYRIESPLGSVKAKITAKLAGRLRYCDNKTVKVMGVVQEDTQSGSQSITLSTIAIWLTDE